MIHRRAVEAVIWGMPVVNYHLMYQEMVRKTNGAFNQVLYWSRLLDWKNQTLTPNPDVIYLMPFINTQDAGPVVLEIPPADDGVFNGSVMSCWHSAIEDVGPGGVDKGKGGKYLILPPGYDTSRVPAGYIAMPSDTYRGYALLRSVLKSDSDDLRFFESLNEMVPPFYEGEHWFFPTTDELFHTVMSFWKTPDSYPIDARGTAYMLAFFSAKHIGESQYYLLTGRDARGQPLDGASSYRLRVPANAPVTQYWSATVYSRDTHAFIRHAARLDRSSQTSGLEKNPDGSVDILLGPAAPKERESNWIPTDAHGRFEVLARFYGPQKALFDKSWVLPDVERVSG